MSDRLDRLDFPSLAASEAGSTGGRQAAAIARMSERITDIAKEQHGLATRLTEQQSAMALRLDELATAVSKIAEQRQESNIPQPSQDEKAAPEVSFPGVDQSFFDDTDPVPIKVAQPVNRWPLPSARNPSVPISAYDNLPQPPMPPRDEDHLNTPLKPGEGFIKCVRCFKYVRVSLGLEAHFTVMEMKRFRNGLGASCWDCAYSDWHGVEQTAAGDAADDEDEEWNATFIHNGRVYT